MHDLDLILTITCGLGVALLFGYLAMRLKLSPIMGYLIAGIVVGPHTPGYVADKHMAKQLAEIGVILLMFGVGLHFHFKELLAVKRIAIPGAIVQSAAATVLSMLIMQAFGWSLAEGAVFGLAISVASTVVLTRILTENRDLHTPVGHIAIGWLVVEDLFTVFILVLIPAIFGAGAENLGAGSLAMVLLWTALKIGGLVAFTFIVGGWVIPRALTLIARTRSNELFTLGILVIALGIAVGSTLVFGVSMELGAFLAGMVVARSHFSTRAATDALPMKDAFAVLFFVSVGMLFDFKAVLESPWLVVATAGIVIIGKPIAAILITLLLRYPLRTALSVGAVLSQIGEFSFIVGSMALDYKIIDEKAFNALVATAILSITMAPFLYRLAKPLEAAIAKVPWLWKILNRGPISDSGPETPAKAAGERRAVVLGYGPVGKTMVRLLKDQDFTPVIVEMNVDTVRKLTADGELAVYGDASHEATLKEAGIASADLFILAASGVAAGADIIRLVKRLNPEIRVIARTDYLHELGDLESAGADAVVSGEGEVALVMTDSIMSFFGASTEEIAMELQRIRRGNFASDPSAPDSQPNRA
jgi:monovalent cation:H+ antiporter-2, CPA2 family